MTMGHEISHGCGRDVGYDDSRDNDCDYGGHYDGNDIGQYHVRNDNQAQHHDNELGPLKPVWRFSVPKRYPLAGAQFSQCPTETTVAHTHCPLIVEVTLPSLGRC